MGGDHSKTRDELKKLQTWNGNKSVRLPGFDYAQHVPYHIIIRACAGSSPFVRPELAAMAVEDLWELNGKLAFYLAAFCVMPDHVHLLLSPEGSGLGIGDIVGRYKGLTTNRSWNSGWRGRLWQPRFFDHIVRKTEGIGQVARYIFENPDRKGLSEDYPYRWFDPELAM